MVTECGHKHGHRVWSQTWSQSVVTNMVTECGHKVTKLKQTKNERFDQVRNFDIVRGRFPRQVSRVSDFDRSGAHG